MGFLNRAIDRSIALEICKMLAVSLTLIFLANLAEAGNDKTVKVTTTENGSSLTLQKGELLEVTLPASFGAGFSWRVRDGADTVLRLKGKPETKKHEGEGPQVGSTEYQVFRFEAHEVGVGKLELEYVRPWEKQTSPAKTYSLTINVK